MTGPGRAHLGQQRRRRTVHAHRHLPARRRGQPAAAAARCRRCWSCAEATGTRPLVPLLADEIVKDEPGQEAVLDRLLDLLLIAVLRAWFARPEAEAPALVPGVRRSGRRPGAAAAAPQPGPPLDGGRAGRRGRRVPRGAGPPLHRAGRRAAHGFLTGWRLALAADLLREPDATVGASPARSATAARSRSAPRSSASAASARGSTAPARPGADAGLNTPWCRTPSGPQGNGIGRTRPKLRRVRGLI